MTGIDDVRRWYEARSELDRLVDGGHGRLEFLRTTSILSRYIDRASRVLDIGGGPGRYASWLVDQGHDVHLFDVVPAHLEQAKALSVEMGAAFVAEVGDARSIPLPDGSADVVLLLGPLYHLTNSTERSRALLEAKRLVRPGGLIVGAAISRLAWLLDAYRRGELSQHWESVVRIYEGDDVSSEGFPAHFHTPAEFRSELDDAGLHEIQLFAVEGFGFVLPDLTERLNDEHRRTELAEALALIETEDSALGLTSHILGVGRTPAV